MEKLRLLRRSSVVSARVYSRDCEANVEKERTGGTFQRLGSGNGGELALPVDPHAVMCKPNHHPLGYHPPRGREGDGMRIPKLPPQEEKGKNRCFSFRRSHVDTLFISTVSARHDPN